MNAKHALFAVGIVGFGAGCSVEKPRATVERATELPTVDSQPLVASSQRPPTEPQLPAVDSLLCVSRSPQPRLVDSADLGDLFYLIVYTLQVTCDNGLDTLSGIRVKELPVVGGDGRLYGIGYDRHGDPSSGYRYDPKSGKVSLLPLPQNFDMSATHVTLSPDARHIAYIWRDHANDQATSGVVRSWPDTNVVSKTPATPVSEEEIDQTRVRWLDANHAEFVYTRGSEDIPPSERPRRWWIYAVVAVDTRAMRVDTLEAEPGLKR